jgi:hypothetical protein
VEFDWWMSCEAGRSRTSKSAHRDIGIAFLPARQVLGETALGFGLHRLPVQCGQFEHGDVTPCVQRQQIDTAARRLVERDRRCEFGSR